MLCQDTGKTEAIHFKHLNMELAKDIDDALGAIAAYGNGEGEIKMPIKNGKVSVIDFVFRMFRTKKIVAN